MIGAMDDSYNANQASMIAALDTAAAAAALDDLPLVACLGEMRELGDQAEEAHRQVLQHMINAEAQNKPIQGPLRRRLLQPKPRAMRRSR